MTHSFKKAAKVLSISATLSMYLMSSSANAALNFNNDEVLAAASPVHSEQQYAQLVRSDRDRGAGHNENDGRNDDNGNDDGHDGNDDGHDGNDDGNDGNDGNDDGNDGEGNDD